MTLSIRFLLSHFTYGALVLGALTACNNQPSADAPSDSEDRIHERSFSWNDPAGNKALFKTASLRTRFENAEDLTRAAMSLDEELTTPEAADSLWKPIDYACDELALGLWNRYGTITLGDSVVLDEKSLKASCRYIGNDSALAASGLAKSAAYPTAVETDRKYPYKMIGESWDDFSVLGVYKSTGAETQFKKERSKFGITGWYDTDATRIGVRIYLIDCPQYGPRNCTVGKSQSDWYSNDDYVSKRDLAAGINVSLHVSDAVIAMHSVDHAGLQFRAVSSSGLTAATQIIGAPAYAYVTW